MVQATTDGQKAKKLVKQMLFPPLTQVVKNKHKVSVGSDEEMARNDFDYGLEDELDIICNMISVLPLEYDTIIKATKEEYELDEKWIPINLYASMLCITTLLMRTRPYLKDLTCLCNNI